jgi:hypothetical protein
MAARGQKPVSLDSCGALGANGAIVSTAEGDSMKSAASAAAIPAGR